MNILEKINELKEELSFFEEEIDKYEYIIEIGKNSSPLEEKYKTQQYQIRGCTSKLWLVCKQEDNVLSFQTDSDTVIVRGLAQMVQSILSNESAKDVLAFDDNLLRKLNLQQIITPSRQNGIGNMIKKIKEFAKEQV